MGNNVAQVESTFGSHLRDVSINAANDEIVAKWIVEFAAFLREECLEEARQGNYHIDRSFSKLCEEFHNPIPKINQSVLHQYLKQLFSHESITYKYDKRSRYVHISW